MGDERQYKSMPFGNVVTVNRESLQWQKASDNTFIFQVPLFDGWKVDTYFIKFQRIAEYLMWSDEVKLLKLRMALSDRVAVRLPPNREWTYASLKDELIQRYIFASLPMIPGAPHRNSAAAEGNDGIPVSLASLAVSRDPSLRVPKFHDVHYLDFFSKVEYLAQLFQWSDADQVMHVKLSLDEQLLAKLQKRKRWTYSALKDALCELSLPRPGNDAEIMANGKSQLEDDGDVPIQVRERCPPYKLISRYVLNLLPHPPATVFYSTPVPVFPSSPFNCID